MSNLAISPMEHPSLSDLMNASDTLPSIPRIVLQVLRELDADDPNPRSIVMLVSTDPALTAKIIALSNSSLFSGGREIGSLNDALSILGFANVRSLVTTAALASSFKTVPDFNLEQFWHYSLNAALVSRTLARSYHMSEGPAFTAGLVHAIGELILHLGAKPSMQYIRTIPFLSCSRVAAEQKLLGYSHADVSAAFVEQWDFPSTLVNSLKLYAQPDQDKSDPLADILQLASWRARSQLLELSQGEMIESFPSLAASRLGLSIGDTLEKDPDQWTSPSQVSMFTR